MELQGRQMPTRLPDLNCSGFCSRPGELVEPILAAAAPTTENTATTTTTAAATGTSTTAGASLKCHGLFTPAVSQRATHCQAGNSLRLWEGASLGSLLRPSKSDEIF